MKAQELETVAREVDKSLNGGNKKDEGKESEFTGLGKALDLLKSVRLKGDDSRRYS